MIRFACGTCGRSLRAPAGLAGKRGRCAHCGKVNQVPVVVSVDVRRSTATVAAPATTGTSPFRSTADVSLHASVQGAIELANPRFLSVPLGSEHLSDDALDFLDQVSSRINELADPLQQFDAPPPVSLNSSRVALGHRPADRGRTLDFDGPATLPLAAALEPRAHPHPPDITKVVFAALTVGVICGFCVGLLASKWMM